MLVIALLVVIIYSDKILLLDKPQTTKIAAEKKPLLQPKEPFNYSLPEHQIAVLKEELQDKSDMQIYLKLFQLENDDSLYDDFHELPLKEPEKVGAFLIETGIRNGYEPLAKLGLEYIKQDVDYQTTRINAIWGAPSEARKNLFRLLNKKDNKIPPADINYFIGICSLRTDNLSGAKHYFKLALDGQYRLNALMQLYNHLPFDELKTYFQKVDKDIDLKELEQLFTFLKTNQIKKAVIRINSVIDEETINLQIFDKKIHGIAINGYPINNTGALDLFPLLTYLAIESANISQIPSLKNKSLKALSLSGNNIKEIEGLGYLDLEQLDLSGNQISNIKGLDSLIALRYLNLERNQILKIENLESLTQLRELLLDGNQISKIEGLESLTQLRMLELRNNKISEEENTEAIKKLKDRGVDVFF